MSFHDFMPAIAAMTWQNLVMIAVVFVVMIIFMFVSKGIDKIFPYKKEDDEN